MWQGLILQYMRYIHVHIRLRIFWIFFLCCYYYRDIGNKYELCRSEYIFEYHNTYTHMHQYSWIEWKKNNIIITKIYILTWHKCSPAINCEVQIMAHNNNDVGINAIYINNNILLCLLLYIHILGRKTYARACLLWEDVHVSHR